MGAAQRRAAAEYQPDGCRVDRSDRRKSLDDVPVLFDEGGTGQSEMRLDLEQRPERDLTAQRSAPLSRHGAAARNVL
jgi:hypothetical protein